MHEPRTANGERAAKRNGVLQRAHRERAQRLYGRILSLSEASEAALVCDTLPILPEVRRVLQLTVGLMEEDDGVLLGLVNLESTSSPAATHAAGVTLLSLGLGRSAQLSRPDLSLLGLAALLHDAGSPALATHETAAGPAQLSMESWRSMRHHTLEAAAHLLRAGELESVAHAALVCLEHHLPQTHATLPAPECEPALASRIVQIADAYVTLLHRPETGGPMSPDRAVALLSGARASQFDPLAVELLVRTLGAYPPGTTLRLDTREVGVVLRPNRDMRYFDRPVVRLVLDAAGVPLEIEMDANLAETLPGGHGFARRVVEAVDPRTLGIDPLRAFLLPSP